MGEDRSKLGYTPSSGSAVSLHQGMVRAESKAKKASAAYREMPREQL